MKGGPVELSVVAPVYQAERFIGEFYRRAAAAASSVTPDFELVFVNDGSTDGSLGLLLSLHKGDPRVVVVDLSRNFGQPNAVRAGLAHARGGLVFTIDDDLEEEPEWLEAFHRELQREKVDVVWGVQERRKGDLPERFFGWLFYFLMKRVFFMECAPNITTARLMTRRYVDALLASGERGFDISIVGHAIGFGRKAVVVAKSFKKSSRYSYRKKLLYFEDYVTSGTAAPLRWIAAAGCGAFLAALGLWARSLFQHVAGRRLVEGQEWALLSLGLLGGAILLSLGVTGIYASKILAQVRNRPLAVVRDVWRAGP